MSALSLSLALRHSELPSGTPQAARKAAILWPARMLSVWRQRRALAQLDAARLDDIGLTPTEARREASRPFWAL